MEETEKEKIKPIKILLIEDDFYTCQLYQDIFSLEPNYQLQTIKTIKNTEKVKEKIEEITPDIILLDLILPLTPEKGGSYILDKELGFEILNKLKSDEKTKDIPVIIVSNINNREDIERVKAIGAEEYLIKSEIFPQQVVSIIERVLQEKKF
ncbi:response regulator [bacterium]|nr:response regulator [bacterium]